MADKAINELVSAEQILPNDLFVLQQNNVAKKLTGQILLNWLTSAADGHGGIQGITGPVVSGLDKTYTIILADQTQYTFTVSDGNGISLFEKVKTEGLIDTYRITYDDGTYYDLMVSNGAKGDKGDNAYVHFKWASQDPSQPPHSIGNIPDSWQGVYSGNSLTAPENWDAYQWQKVEGEKGETGDPATLLLSKIEYQASDSGTVYPNGSWSENVPVVPAGKYLWTRVTLGFNTGNPVVIYSVGRFGIDGTGAVSAVNSISPDSNGNVVLAASDLGAMPASGGSFSGPVNMDGQPLSGLNTPTEGDQPATKTYVDSKKKSASVSLVASGWSNNQQTVTASGVTTENDVIVSPSPDSFSAYTEAVIRAVSQGSGTITFSCESTPASDVSVNILVLD